MERMKDRVKVWDLPVRLFHWTLVVAIAVALLSAEEGSPLHQWHVLSGWVAGILIVFRLVWGFIGGEHSRFADFIHPSRIATHIAGVLKGRSEPTLGHNPLGAVAVVALIALTAVTVWTGAFGGEPAEEVHEIAGWTLLGLVGLHVAAVVIMSVIERENLVRAMITGEKPMSRHPDASDARPPMPWALIAGAIVIAVTAYAILRYDPDAFTPRSAEAFEHRGEESGSTSPDHGGDDDPETDPGPGTRSGN